VIITSSVHDSKFLLVNIKKCPVQIKNQGPGRLNICPEKVDLRTYREPESGQPFSASTSALGRTALLAWAKNVGAHQTKTQIVVEVIWFVPISVSTAGVVSIIVPRAAAHHPRRYQPAPY
jgi:hypothetical protein